MRFRSGADLFQQFMTRQPVMAWGLSLIWVMGLGFLVYFWHLGSVGLVDETEPLFAEAARQMTLTGDWITPMFNDATRFDKPPLIYWLVALGYQLLGVNEWAARLPSALAALALVGGCFWILLEFAPLSAGASQAQVQTQAVSRTDEFSGIDLPQKEYTPPPASPRNWLAAWLGAAIMALHPLTLIWAHTGVSDLLLSGCVGLSLLAFFAGYAQPPKSRAKTLWYCGFYGLMALSVLTKGPVGIVIPAITIGVFALYLGNIQALWRELFVLRGLLLTLAISLPWFILVTLRNGEAYIDSFFGYHNFDRFVSVVNRHSAPWYFYFLIVLIGFMPWSTYLPVAIANLHLLKRQFWQRQPRTQQLGLFACSWFLSVFGFFTISVTKLPSYVLPLMPAAALLVALWWSDRLQADKFTPALRWMGWVQVAFLALYTTTFWVLPHLLGPDAAAPMLYQDMQTAGIFWGSALIWGIATLLEAACLLRRDGLGLWLVNTLAFIIFVGGILLPVTFIVDSHRQLPLRQIAQIIPQVRQGQEPLLMFGFKKPTMVFYSHQTFGFYWQGKEYLQNIQQEPQRLPALLVISEESWAELNLQNYPVIPELIEQRGSYKLLRLLPQRK